MVLMISYSYLSLESLFLKKKKLKLNKKRGHTCCKTFGEDRKIKIKKKSNNPKTVRMLTFHYISLFHMSLKNSLNIVCIQFYRQFCFQYDINYSLVY